MNTIIAQAFAKMPPFEPESHLLAYAVLIGASATVGFIAGLLLGRFQKQRNSYNAGYLAGFENLSNAIEGDINCPPSVFNAPTIKISPRPVKSPFTVSREGQLAQDMGWQKGGREIQ